MQRSNSNFGNRPPKKGGSRKQANQAVTKEQVRQMIQSATSTHIERKFCDKLYTNGVSYNGQVDYLLDSLSRGDTSTTCTGNLIRVRRVEIRGVMYTNQSYTSMRLLVFKWKDSTSPAPTGIFQTLASAEAPYSPLSIVNLHKIEILCEKLITCFPVAGSYAAKNFVFDCRCDIQVQLPSTIPSASAQMDGIMFAYVSDDGIPTYPQIEYQSRVTFEDA